MRMRASLEWAIVTSCLGATALVAACADRSSEAASRPPVTASGGDVPEILAVIGDEEVSVADLGADLGEQLAQMENRYRQARHDLIDEALRVHVQNLVLTTEAERRGSTVDELIASEAEGGLEVTDVEVAAWYNENQGRLGGRSQEQLTDEIRNHIRNERRAAALEIVEGRLRAAGELSYRLEPFRVRLNNDGAPTRGAAGAPVTLVEFSDFECPYCRGFAPTLDRLEEHYGDRLRIVYRHYPIASIHPNAFKAAEASMCAEEQGRFWEFHDALFANQSRLAVRDLKSTAGALGLNQGDFDACLDTGRYTETVQSDLAEAKMAGVSGTPALFVNGIPVKGGAVSFETLTTIIDRELDRVTG